MHNIDEISILKKYNIARYEESIPTISWTGNGKMLQIQSKKCINGCVESGFDVSF